MPCAPVVAFAGEQTADGGYVLGGYSRSFNAGNYEFYLVKTMGDDTVGVQAGMQPRSFVVITGTLPPLAAGQST